MTHPLLLVTTCSLPFMLVHAWGRGGVRGRVRMRVRVTVRVRGVNQQGQSLGAGGAGAGEKGKTMFGEESNGKLAG